MFGDIELHILHRSPSVFDQVGKDVAMTDVLLFGGVITTTLVTALMILMHLYKLHRDSRYDAEKQRAELDSMRKHLEEQIYKVTDRLLSSEKRWEDVNHLPLSYAKRTDDDYSVPSRTAQNNFLKSLNIDSTDLVVQQDLVFVLMPFHPRYQLIFTVIADVCTSAGLRCVRGDEQQVSGELLPHIMSHILRARLIIAVIDGRNPNVFYELGVAHAFDKPTILIARAVKDTPFDVRSRKLITYQSRLDLREKLKLELTRALVAR